MQPAVVIIRLQYQRRPELGCPNEDTYSGHPMRAAVRIQLAIQPELSGPLEVARNLIRTALVEPTKQSLSCFRERFHLSAPSDAPELQKQQTTGAFRDVRNPFRGLRNA